MFQNQKPMFWKGIPRWMQFRLYLKFLELTQQRLENACKERLLKGLFVSLRQFCTHEVEITKRLLQEEG